MTTDGGGWTVFQNRFDGSVEFYRNFSEYEIGFGHLNGEFWLGLENLHELVSQDSSELRIDVSAANGMKGYVTFEDFQISPGTNYSLHISPGNGTIGDSTASGLSFNNNAAFSTYDYDQDSYSGNCASINEGAWWFSECTNVHLNGQYCTPGTNTCGFRGMIYFRFRTVESLLTSRMMFRRV
ncbi:fibrinogen-like protein A [Mercenaria mercenaria]|uniref:fibrinogen-like protein A n=1 Tax=Mercenaria mercenaria TaxID=6596 RepID=UPI00234E4B89|nr:fibrinogen-like protein A [Mercenaria mercenaria]